MRKTFFGTRLMGLLLILAFAALGQREAGQITGTVRDPSGAVVAAAKVTVKSVGTGSIREATSNMSGIYTVPSLRPDTYDVSVEAAGFEKFQQRVTVAVGSNNEVSVQLSVSASKTTLEVVESGAVQVNTETQTLSEVITSQQLTDLPTSPTRDPYQLVAIAGNVTKDASSARGVGFTINGQRSSSTSILLDGAENVDTYTASLGQTVPLDSVQEFSVLTNNFTAEYGRASGGVVNVVTKSGTNEYHGSGYEFNRVSALSANTFNNNANDIAKSPFTRNNFGASVGGPVKKDKIFFFNNTEWIRVRSSSNMDYTIIDPSSYAKLATASQGFFSQYGKLAPDAHTLSTVPCASLTCDVVNFSVPADAGGGMPQNTWMEVARVDFNLSEKNTMFVRYAAYNEMDFPGTINASPYAGYNTGQNSFDQNAAVTLTHVFTPNIVDSVKLVYNRLKNVQPLATAPVSPTLYTASNTPSVAGFPLIFPGYSETTPGNSIPFGGPQNLYQFFNDFAWTRGKHQIKVGGSFIQIRDNRTYGAYENAVEYLGTNLSSGLANLVSGNIYQFQGAIYPQGKYPCAYNAQGVAQVTAACTVTLPVTEPSFERNYRYNDSALYIQDSWKAMQRLTVNLGLRWEYYGVQHNANPLLDSNFVMGQGATIFDQIRNGSVQLAKDGGVFWKPDYKNLGPRTGFAYDLLGDGSTSIRGGYSIGYERNFGNVTFNAIQNPPNYAVVSLIAGQDVPSMPVYTNNAGPMAGTGSKALPLVSQRAINQNMKNAYANTWDIGIDRRVSKNGVVSLSYSGSHSVHLYDISNINLAGGGSIYLGDARASNRLNYQYSNMNYRSDNGYGFYDALNFKYSASNLFNKGLGVTMNYTWSHSLDNLSSTFSEGAGGGASGNYSLGYLDPFNPQLNYGNSDYDIRQRLVLSANWEMPWLKGSTNKFVKDVVAGWGFGSILNIHSGMPFSLYDCNNSNGTDCPLWVPNSQVNLTGNAVAATGSFSPNTFNYITLPNTKGVVNNQGDSLGMPKCKGLYHQGCTYTADGLPYPSRNMFVGPGFWNLDMNFYKTFRIKERMQLQLRGEMYNIFNHSNQYISYYNLDVSSMTDNNGNASPFVQTEKGGIYGSAGQPTDERRNIQFGLKLTF